MHPIDTTFVVLQEQAPMTRVAIEARNDDIGQLQPFYYDETSLHRDPEAVEIMEKEFLSIQGRPL